MKKKQPYKLTELSNKEMVVEYRRVFSKDLYYPINELAQDVAVFCRRTSYTVEDIQFLERLCFKVEVRLPVYTGPFKAMVPNTTTTDSNA